MKSGWWGGDRCRCVDGLQELQHTAGKSGDGRGIER